MKWCISIGLLALISTNTMAGDQGNDGKHDKTPVAWTLHGFDRLNSANSSSISQITKHNLDKLKLKWIYNVPVVPLGSALNPIANPRAENAPSTGVVVDDKGIIYVPIFDGTLVKIDSLKIVGKNADGSGIPKVLQTLDFFADPEYAGDGFDGFASRLHPSIIGNALYAGNYKWFDATTALSTPDVPNYAPKGTGTTSPSDLNYSSKGAVLYKIDRHTGKLLWKTVIDSNQQSMISAVGVTRVEQKKKRDNLLIVGFSSEISGTLALYPIGLSPTPDPFAGTCCNYRGGVAAVRESDGKLLWKTYTSPKQEVDSLDTIIKRGTVNSWMGSSVWSGGNFPVSYRHGLVYSGSGEEFSSPDAADQCEQDRLKTTGAPEVSTKCLRVLQDGKVSDASFADTRIEQFSPKVRSPILPQPDTIVAYEYKSGKIKWSQPLGGFDVWNGACFGPLVPGFPFVNFSPFCPPYLRDNLPLQLTTKDRDAGVPILVEDVEVNGKVRDIVLAITKAALVQAFDAASGKSLWGPVTFGHGGLNGDGFVWGQAVDGKRFYGNTGTSSNLTLAQYQDPSNPAHVVPGSCDLSGGPGSGFDPVTGVWKGGMYVAVNLADGSVAWQRCVVGKVTDPATRLPTGETVPARSQAPVSVAKGLVVVSGATSYSPKPDVPESPNTFGEVLILDADTGALLKTLPLSVPGQPSGNTLVYQRPIIVGDRLYISNGNKRYDGLPNARDAYNRILMYQLEKNCDHK